MISPTAAVEDRTALLVADDDILLLQTLGIFFAGRGFQVAMAASLREAQTRFWSRQTWAAIISDDHLLDGTGIEFCSWVREQPGPAPPFLIMSGGAKAGTIPGVEFLAKPFGLVELERRVRGLLQRGSS